MENEEAKKILLAAGEQAERYEDRIKQQAAIIGHLVDHLEWHHKNNKKKCEWVGGNQN